MAIDDRKMAEIRNAQRYLVQVVREGEPYGMHCVENIVGHTKLVVDGMRNLLSHCPGTNAFRDRMGTVMVELYSRPDGRNVLLGYLNGFLETERDMFDPDRVEFAEMAHYVAFAKKSRVSADEKFLDKWTEEFDRRYMEERK